MLKTIKYQLKSLLPVRADEPENDFPVEKTFVTLSLQRSGQHAIIDWLCHQAGEIAHFNHCQFERRGTINWITPINKRVVLYRGEEKLDSGIQDRQKMQRFLCQNRNYRQALYSFEDTDIENPFLNNYIRSRNPVVILILRDPYNWLASSIKHNRNSPDLLYVKKRMLVKYLEQALKRRNYLRQPVVIINYNKWVNQPGYRQHLCEELAIPFSEEADSSVENIQDFGGGSSFDGLAADSGVLKSAIFRRWEDYVSDPFYQDFFNDRYLNELTEIFFETKKPF